MINKIKSINDQLYQLSNKLDKQSYNINAFKRRKSLSNSSTQKIFTTLSTEIDRQQTKFKKYSAQKSSKFQPKKPVRRIGPASNRNKKKHITDFNLNSTQNTFLRRNPITIVNNNNIKQKQIYSVNLINHQKIIQKVKTQQLINNTTFIQKQRSIFKNKILQDSHFENWINQILIQRCPQQKYDKNINNPGLKKFQVDRNTLISYGISHQNISRILKSLFIYSIGFNNLIMQLGNHKIQVKKNLWRVFSILIEYCSSGTIQTILTNIQRQNEKDVEHLKEQIQRQAQAIENNENRNKQKNEKLYQENKQLLSKNQRLQLDREMLKQNSQEIQHAFSQEISLRLNFQRKISDLHQLHRELQLKHHKLFSDFQLKVNQLAYFKEKSNYYCEQNLRLKKDKSVIEDNLAEKCAQMNAMNEICKKLKRQLNQQYSIDTQRIIDKKILSNLLRQKQLKQNHLKNQLVNIQKSLQIQQRSNINLLSQYHDSLQQNGRLMNKLNNELLQISIRLRQQRQMNIQNEYFLSQINILNLKMQQKLQLLNNLQILLNNNINKINQLQIQNQNYKYINQFLKNSMEKQNQNILDLKKINKELQQKIQSITIINQQYQYKLKQLITLQSSSHQSIKYLKYTIECLEIQNKRLKGRQPILQQQVTNLQKDKVNKIEELQNAYKMDRQKLFKLQRQIVNKSVQCDKYHDAFRNMQQRYKNQKFERDSLEFRYRHALTAVQNSHQVIKQKDIKIVQTQNHLDQTILKLKINTIELDKLNNKINKQQQQNKKYKLLLQQMKCKNITFIHPMIYQDLLSLKQRLQQKVNNDRQLIEQQQLSHSKQRQKLKNTIQKQDMKINQMRQQYDSILIRKNHEIQYEQKKHQFHLQKIQQLQILIKAKQNIQQKQSNIQTNKQKQRRYLEIISQNYFKIKSISNDLEIIQNHNHQLIQRIQSNQKQLQRNYQIIRNIQYQKKQLIQKKQKLQEQNKIYNIIQQDLIKEINQKQSLITTYIPQYRTLKLSASQQLKKKRQNSPISRDKSLKKSIERKQSLLQPIKIKIKEKQQIIEQEAKDQNTKQIQKSSFDNPDWRIDFKQKLKNSFNYYN